MECRPIFEGLRFVQLLKSPRLRIAPALVFALALLAAACGAGGAADDQTASGDDETGTAETSASGLSGEFATIDGGSVNLADFEGQDVVLWFWAPW